MLKAGATAVFGKHVGPDALSDAIRIALKTHGKVRDAQTERRKTNWKRGLEQRRPA